MSDRNNSEPASGVAPRSEAASTPLAGEAGAAPLANRGVNLVKGYLATGGFDTLEVTLLGDVTSKWEREIRPWMFGQKTAAKERKLGELEWHCIKPEIEGNDLRIVGQPFQVHANNGRPYGQLRTQFKLALGDASWLHLAAAPLKPGRWGIGRVELTEQFHGGCITDAIDSVKNLVNAFGFDVTATAVTRADLAVNLPGAHVPALAERVYDGVRGWLAKSTHKRVLGDPPGTIYIGDWQAGHYGFCIYHKISELKWLAKQGKITTEELCQRQQRFAAWGCPEEVTRVELRMKGMHLRKYERARTVEGLADQAADLYAIHATKGLAFTEDNIDRRNRNQARSKVHSVWQKVQETAQAVPWNLQNAQKASHRVSRETQGMTAEKYIERAVRDLLRAVSLAEGEYESSLDVAAAMIACITPERIDGMDFREIMHAARQKFATPEQLRELGIPDEAPTVDDWGIAVGARRVQNPNRLSRTIMIEARAKLDDLLCRLPF